MWGRNLLTNPGRTTFDMALFKRFAIKENIGFEFRAEAFNVFNHTRWGGPGGTCSELDSDNHCVSGNGFLQVSSSHNPRIMQFGLKFIFLAGCGKTLRSMLLGRARLQSEPFEPPNISCFSTRGPEQAAKFARDCRHLGSCAGSARGQSFLAWLKPMPYPKTSPFYVFLQASRFSTGAQ